MQASRVDVEGTKCECELDVVLASWVSAAGGCRVRVRVQVRLARETRERDTPGVNEDENIKARKS